MTGFVYFMQAGASGPVKIGFSGTSVERRIAGNQTGCPQPIALLGVVVGDIQLERRFHKAFRTCALRGEWFTPHPRLISFIKKVAKPLPTAIAEKPPDLTPLAELAWMIDHEFEARGAFARRIGISEAYLSQVLSGKRPLARMPAGKLLRFSMAAGVPLERLAGGLAE